MTAIISRSQESATQATPAARERKQDQVPAAVLPSNASPGVGTRPEVNWRPLARAGLTVIADLLAGIEEPPAEWTPCDTPCELITIVACRLHNLPDDEGSEAWQSRTDLLHELVWPRESLRAAVELGVSRGWSLTTPDAFGHLMAATNKLGALCAALEEPNDVARQHQFAAICSGQEDAIAPPDAAAKPFQEKPRPPIRRDPAAEAVDAVMIEAISDQAVRTTLLVDWCLKARGVLDHIASAADGDSALRSALREHEIAFRNASWRDCRMGECLEDVLNNQFHLIRQLAGGAA